MAKRTSIVVPLVIRAVRFVRLGMRNIDFEIPVVEGDTGPVVELRIVDKKGSPVDLTDKQVNLFLRRSAEGESVSGQDPTCQIESAVSGIVSYQFGPFDLGEPGTYFGDVQIIGDNIETAPDALRFLVRSRQRFSKI
ncbi:MAG: hypothetical protein ACRCXD_00050 [Luteolibacter sp.]